MESRCLLLGFLTLMKSLEVDGRIRRCGPKRPRRTIHLCLGDTAVCRDSSEKSGSWNVTKKDYCNGLLTQVDRQVELKDRNSWNLPCYFHKCKYDFTCEGNRNEDEVYKERLLDGLCWKEALESRNLEVQKRARQSRITHIDATKLKRRSVSNWHSWDSNQFVQAYRKMFYNSTACYPSLSFSDLFTPIPLPDPTEYLVQEFEEKPHINVTKEITLRMTTCLNGTGNNANVSYPFCWNGTGHGCAVVWVPTNLACIYDRTTYRCNEDAKTGEVNCHPHQHCLNLTGGGPQLVCGNANQTHMIIGEYKLTIMPRFGGSLDGATPFVHPLCPGWNSMAPWFALSAPARGARYAKYLQIAQYLQTAFNKKCNQPLEKTGVVYTKNDYWFFYQGKDGKGKASNFLVPNDPDGPTQVAVGMVAPLTVPCPTEWKSPQRYSWSNRLKRDVSKEFCADWNNPQSIGGRGHVFGYALGSLFSLGASAGAEAAENRNYLTCGLTIVGNETRDAIAIIRKSLSDLRAFTYQNRYALDYLLAREGGVCAIVKGTCIMGVEDRSEDLLKIEDNLSTWLSGMTEGYGWGDWGFGGWYDWVINMLIYLAIIVCCIFVGIAIFKCILARMMKAVSGIGDSLASMKTTQRMMIQRLEETSPLMEHDSDDDAKKERRVIRMKEITKEEEYKRLARVWPVMD